MNLSAVDPATTGTAPIGGNRLFAAPGPDYQSHRRTFGPLPSADRTTLMNELRQSGLDGRGGAGFAAWQKFASVPSDQRPVVVANGAEGEPLSRKDATLLHRAPHLVLDGLLLAGQCLDAHELHLYATAAQLQPVARALKERDDGRIRLHEAPDTFISGEATAVVSALEGGPPIPRDRTVRLTERGFRGRPTLVHNVETLAQLALIARFGAPWFRSMGTGIAPGTRLVTVSGHPGGAAVYEVPTGAPVRRILQAAGVDADQLRAALAGGYHGTWLGAPQLDSAFSREGLGPHGARPGAGIILALGAHECGLAASAQIAAYLASQSARQCGPCINGLPAIAALLQRLASGERDGRLAEEIRRLSGLLPGRGACAHPDGTSRFVLSSLTTFASDVRAHLNGRCEAQS